MKRRLSIICVTVICILTLLVMLMNGLAEDNVSINNQWQDNITYVYMLHGIGLPRWNANSFDVNIFERNISE